MVIILRKGNLLNPPPTHPTVDILGKKYKKSNRAIVAGNLRQDGYDVEMKL